MRKRNRWIATLAVGSIVGALTVVGLVPAASASPVFYCDIDGDFFSDFPVGATNEDFNGKNDGRIDILYGVPELPFLTEGVIRNSVSNGDKLGQTVMCADLNGDGFQDLVMGVPFANTNGRKDSGEVLIVYGAADGLNFDHQDTITQATPGVADKPQREDLFGYELSSGDFNGDGFADLVISAPGEDIGGRNHAGMVHILYGSANGILDVNGRARGRVLHQNSPGIRDKAEAEDFFGIALGAADFDGDGWLDLAVGVPLEDVNGKADAGAINVIYGTPTGLGKRDQFIHQDRKSVDGAAEAGDRFGAPLFPTQLIGRDFLDCLTQDCKFELVVGVPGEDLGSKRDAGLIHVLAGTSRGLSGRAGQTVSRDTRGINKAASAGDEFGHSIITGFFNDDLILDLAIGVPGDDIGGRNDAGSVHLIFGDGNGLSSRDKVISLNSKGVPGKAKTEDRFGSTLAAGAFYGGLRTDLAVGIPLKNVRGKRDAGAVLILRGGQGGPGALLINQDDLLDDNSTNRGDNFGNFNAALPGFRGNSASAVLHDRVDPTPDRGPSVAVSAGKGRLR